MKWISVKERLPATRTECLWFDGNSTIYADIKVHIDSLVPTSCGLCCAVNYLHNYTHWMPLPAAPEVEE